MVEPEWVVNSVFSSVTYVIPCGEVDHQPACWLVDCGDVEKVLDKGYYVRGVLLTHVHYDHIYGLNRLLAAMPQALIYTNADGEVALQDPRLNFSRYHPDVPDFVLERPEAVRVAKDEVMLLNGGLQVEVWLTPGHTPNCLTYLVDGNMFTGDAYIPGVKVVTTFPRSNKVEAARSLARLQEMEKTGITVRPGHWIS